MNQALATKGAPAEAPSAAALTPVTLALNWKPEPQFGGFYAAQLEGAYAKHGLKVKIQAGGAGTPVVQMVASGQVDFGIVSADEVVLSRANGGDVVAIYAVYQTNPQAIMVHAERALKDLNDVFASPGTLAWQKGLPYAQYLEKKLRDEKRVLKVQRVPYLGGIGPFLASASFSQQCFVTSEPLAAEKAGVKVKTFLVADAGFNPYTTVLVTRGDIVKKNQALSKSLVEAVREGWQYYLQHPEAANTAMNKLNPSMDATTFALSAKAQYPLIATSETRSHGLGWMSKLRWDELVHQLRLLGLTKTEPSSDSMFTIL